MKQNRMFTIKQTYKVKPAIFAYIAVQTIILPYGKTCFNQNQNEFSTRRNSHYDIYAH